MAHPLDPTPGFSFLSRRRTIITSALALTFAAGVVVGPAAAQDGTGAATPTPPTACEVLPATVTEPPAVTTTGDDAIATPIAAIGATPAATPVMEGATPEASPAVAATAADPLAQDLEAAATAIAGCLGDSQFDTLVLLTGDLYRGQLLGINEGLGATAFIDLAATLPNVAYQILSVEDASFADDTTATAVVTYELSHQVRTSTWEFSLEEVEGETIWVLQSEAPMSPQIPAGATTVTVEIADNSYTLPEGNVQGPWVALQATNEDATDHEMLVLRLEGDATTETLLTSPGPNLPEGLTFIGQATVPAGGQGTLLLAGLQPGTYAIVDLFPNADGIPNLVDGMEVTFTVE